MEAHRVTRSEQVKLHAYVCGNACLQTVDNEGTMSFVMVYMKRPADCRYAIVTRYNVVTHLDEVVVWDLFEAQENLKTGRLIPPTPRLVCDSIDAAVMATFMLYEDD
jgi:hypothetical protein